MAVKILEDRKALSRGNDLVRLGCSLQTGGSWTGGLVAFPWNLQDWPQRLCQRNRVEALWTAQLVHLFPSFPAFPRWVIYNDQKVCASEKPPKDLGYIYFYQRVAS